MGYAIRTCLAPRIPSGTSRSSEVIKPPTAGVWSDPSIAQTLRQGVAAPTVPTPYLYVLDLMDVLPTVDIFEKYLVPFAQEIKLGQYGQSSLAVSTRNPSVRRFAELLSAQLELPVWIAASTATLQVAEALPAGNLSATDVETLRAVADLGGRVGAAEIAKALSLQHTAALNRLASLASRRYLHRESRSGRSGDVFVHPLHPAQEQAFAAIVSSVDGVVEDGERNRLSQHLQQPMKGSAGKL